jgi:uncharacterized protein (DUF1330 family)
MTVYVIANVKFTKEELYRRYQARFFDVFRQFKGRLLVADEAPKVLDGAFPHDKVVVMQFPDQAEAERFLYSPAYEEISKDRIAGANVVSVLVRGLAGAA